jgi:hypothetical protein
MKYMMLIALLIVATVLAYGVRTAPSAERPSAPTHSRAVHMCQEDEACWNWTTMGDGQRGIYVDGGVTIVTAESFCRIPARIRNAQPLPFDPNC